MHLTTNKGHRTITLKKVNGFTLLEVLIAVSILAIGMLGIAAMHLTSLKDNRDAYMRSQAVLLSHDMAERMRSNKSQLAAYGAIDTSKTAASVSCTNCSPADMVKVDIKEWSKKINTTTGSTGLIPSAKGTVKLFKGNIFIIEVSWQLDGAAVSAYSIRVAI